MQGEGIPNIVVPTCKNRLFDGFYANETSVTSSNFLEHWREEFDGCHLIIIYDDKEFPKNFEKNIRSFLKPSTTLELHNWRTIENDLGERSWIIPRRTSAIRSYGFYRAWKNKASFIVTLDDDTAPANQGHIKKFYELLFSESRVPATGWFSTLNNRTPRGTRYFDVAYEIAHGGWIGCLDLNAHDQAIDKDYGGGVEENFYNGSVPFNTLFSMCGMNLAFRTTMAKYLYFTLQNEVHREGKVFTVPTDRTDDIMAGIWAVEKAKPDIHTGEPFVYHNRASNVWSNIRKEHNWERVIFDFVEFAKTGETETFDELRDYFELLSDAYEVWDSLFTN